MYAPMPLLRVREGCRVLVDSLGYGLSSKPHTAEGYSRKRQVADLVAVLEAAEAPRADVPGYFSARIASYGELPVGDLAVASTVHSAPPVRIQSPPGTRAPPWEDMTSYGIEALSGFQRPL